MSNPDVAVVGAPTTVQSVQPDADDSKVLTIQQVDPAAREGVDDSGKVLVTISDGSGDDMSIVVNQSSLPNPAQPAPGNPGEDLTRNEQNDQLDPVMPGVEPGQGADDPPPGEEAPAGAEEGAESPPETPGEAPGGEGEPPGEETPAAEPEPQEKDQTLYTIEEDVPVPEGFQEAGYETPDGRVLYTFDGDVKGKKAKGKGEGVTLYAEEIVPAEAE